MTVALGIDIGSRTVDAVWLEDGVVLDEVVEDTGFEPRQVVERLLARRPYDTAVATGYGRHVARDGLGIPAITEIKAYGLGAAMLHPPARAVLDIGGQDTKAIALGADGRVVDFMMNDKCAAGTGKFLEVMARALGFSLEEMAEASLSAERGVRVSSMCTVFAESEVTGLVHRGEDRAGIARGLHESIVTRTMSSLKRVGASAPLVFAGGVAKNSAVVASVRERFDGEVVVPLESQTVGALGAALAAVEGSP